MNNKLSKMIDYTAKAVIAATALGCAERSQLIGNDIHRQLINGKTAHGKLEPGSKKTDDHIDESKKETLRSNTGESLQDPKKQDLQNPTTKIKEDILRNIAEEGDVTWEIEKIITDPKFPKANTVVVKDASGYMIEHSAYFTKGRDVNGEDANVLNIRTLIPVANLVIYRKAHVDKNGEIQLISGQRFNTQGLEINKYNRDVTNVDYGFDSVIKRTYLLDKLIDDSSFQAKLEEGYSRHEATLINESLIARFSDIIEAYEEAIAKASDYEGYVSHAKDLGDGMQITARVQKYRSYDINDFVEISQDGYKVTRLANHQIKQGGSKDFVCLETPNGSKFYSLGLIKNQVHINKFKKLLETLNSSEKSFEGDMNIMVEFNYYAKNVLEFKDKHPEMPESKFRAIADLYLDDEYNLVGALEFSVKYPEFSPVELKYLLDQRGSLKIRTTFTEYVNKFAKVKSQFPHRPLTEIKAEFELSTEDPEAYATIQKIRELDPKSEYKSLSQMQKEARFRDQDPGFYDSRVITMREAFENGTESRIDKSFYLKGQVAKYQEKVLDIDKDTQVKVTKHTADVPGTGIKVSVLQTIDIDKGYDKTKNSNPEDKKRSTSTVSTGLMSNWHREVQVIDSQGNVFPMTEWKKHALAINQALNFLNANLQDIENYANGNKTLPSQRDEAMKIFTDTVRRTKEAKRSEERSKQRAENLKKAEKRFKEWREEQKLKAKAAEEAKKNWPVINMDPNGPTYEELGLRPDVQESERIMEEERKSRERYGATKNK